MKVRLLWDISRNCNFDKPDILNALVNLFLDTLRYIIEFGLKLRLPPR